MTGHAYRCPGCRYDVSATLADGIGTCPECGIGITRASCAHDARSWRRGGLRAVWRFFVGMACLACATGALAWIAYALADATGAEWLTVLGVLVGYTGATIALLALPTLPIGLVPAVHGHPSAPLAMLLYAWIVLIGVAGLVIGLAGAGLVGIALDALVG